MQEKKRDPRWATYLDEHGDYTGTLAASREGLVHLRSKIDEALVKGEAKIDTEGDLGFASIRIVEIHPSDRLKPRPVLDRVFKAGCLSLIAAVLILIGIGAQTLWDMVTK